MPYFFERERRRDYLEAGFSVAKQTYEQDRSAGLLVLRQMVEMLPDSSEIKDLCDSQGMYYFRERTGAMPLRQALLYYIDFLYTRNDMRYNHDEVLADLADKLENSDDISETTKWLVVVVLEILGDEAQELVDLFDGFYYTRPLLRILGKCPEASEKIIPVFMNFLRASEGNHRQELFGRMYDRVGSAMAFRLIGEYFTGSSEGDTFLSGGLFGVMTDIIDESTTTSWRGVNWQSVDSETIQALEGCLRNIEEALPVLDERGHIEIALRGSGELIKRFPEVKKLMGDKLLRRIKRLKEKHAVKHSGRLSGRLDDNYDYLSDLYDSLPTTAQVRLSRMIEKEGDEYVLFEILSNLFTSSQSKKLDGEYFPTKKEAGQISLCLSKNSLVIELMNLMADDPEYRFQMGVLLSMMDFSDLPDRLKDSLGVEVTDCNQKLWPKNESWYLCESAEPRMVEAMFNGGVLLVNNNLLVKFNGKLSAMCLRSFTTKGGFTFLRGNWYCPVDEDTRNYLLESFEKERVEIHLEFDSEWALMRPVEKVGGNTPDDLIGEANKISKRLAGKQRRKFSLEDD